MSNTSGRRSRPQGHRNRGLAAAKRLLQILWNYRIARKDTVDYQPYRLWVEPTAVCNLKCQYCPNNDLAKRESLGFMEFGLFKKVIDEACEWVHDINVHHRGESLLHPRFFDMVNYAGERGVYTKLHTNATKMDEEIARTILDSSLDLLSFSFDGFDKLTYERYRRPAKFESTLENILRFLRMKRERGQTGPITVLEVIRFPDSKVAFSEEKKREFEMIFEGLPLDRLIVKRAHNWAGNTSIDEGIYTADFVPCTFLWHSLVVMWDGRVGPCPHDFMGEIILGDASKQTLEEIFNTPIMKRLRRQMVDGKLEEWLPCNRCDTVKREAVMGLPTQSFKYLK